MSGGGAAGRLKPGLKTGIPDSIFQIHHSVKPLLTRGPVHWGFY